MQPRLVHALALFCLLGGATLAYASIQSPHGPIPSVSGAPAFGGKPEEYNCTLCHTMYDLNPLGGRVEILNVPEFYTPGATYPITVRLRSESTLSSAIRKWGFQLTAAKKSDGEGVGTFVLPAPDTLQVVPGLGDFASRSYVEHRYVGTRTGLAGPVQWTFSWRAPDSDQGEIYFFCAGNAGDGTNDTDYDFIYTTSDSSVAEGTLDVVNGRGALALAPPWPSPARGATTIVYTLPVRARIDLGVFDASGRRVRRLASGSSEAGARRLAWDARDEAGVRLPAGVYFVRLDVAGEGRALTRKLVLSR